MDGYFFIAPDNTIKPILETTVKIFAKNYYTDPNNMVAIDEQDTGFGGTRKYCQCRNRLILNHTVQTMPHIHQPELAITTLVIFNPIHLFCLKIVTQHMEKSKPFCSSPPSVLCMPLPLCKYGLSNNI